MKISCVLFLVLAIFQINGSKSIIVGHDGNFENQLNMEANLKKDSHVNSSAFQLIYKAPKFEMSHVYGSDSDKYRLSLSPYDVEHDKVDGINHDSVSLRIPDNHYQGHYVTSGTLNAIDQNNKHFLIELKEWVLPIAGVAILGAAAAMMNPLPAPNKPFNNRFRKRSFYQRKSR